MLAGIAVATPLVSQAAIIYDGGATNITTVLELQATDPGMALINEAGGNWNGADYAQTRVGTFNAFQLAGRSGVRLKISFCDII